MDVRRAEAGLMASALADQTVDLAADLREVATRLRRVAAARGEREGREHLSKAAGEYDQLTEIAEERA